MAWFPTKRGYFFHERKTPTRHERTALSNHSIGVERAKLGVLILHGSFAGVRETRPWRYAGIADDVPVVAMDVRGHGDSEAGWNRLSVDDLFTRLHWSEMANDVVAVADDAKFDRVVIGGMSMGTAVALWTAMLPHTRSRVAGLVLIKPPDAWHRREMASCTLRRRLQTHAAFAGTLMDRDGTGRKTLEERAEAESIAGMPRPEARVAVNREEWVRPVTRWGEDFLSNDTVTTDDLAAFNGYLKNVDESWDTITPLTPMRYIADKISNYPSVGAIQASFRRNNIPVMVIAHQWSESHPLPIAKALQVITRAAWRRRDFADKAMHAGLVEDVAKFVDEVRLREAGEPAFQGNFWSGDDMGGRGHPRVRKKRSDLGVDREAGESVRIPVEDDDADETIEQLTAAAYDVLAPDGVTPGEDGGTEGNESDDRMESGALFGDAKVGQPFSGQPNVFPGEAADETARLLAETSDRARRESEAQLSLTLNRWLTRTYGDSFSLRSDAMRLARLCQPGCCQLFEAQDVSERRQAACLEATGSVKDDAMAKEKCTSAMAPHSSKGMSWVEAPWW